MTEDSKPTVRELRAAGFRAKNERRKLNRYTLSGGLLARRVRRSLDGSFGREVAGVQALASGTSEHLWAGRHADVARLTSGRSW